ncbi:MAG: DUF2085 domain-containing protein [Candidatus Hodarchaeota archaeon]
MDYISHRPFQKSENENSDVKTYVKVCYKGILEHTHNFHLPYKYVGNRFMYICSRCLGMYGGAIIWISIFLIFPRCALLLQSLNTFNILIICFVLTLPLVIDWLLQCLAVHHSSNIIRLTTGLLVSLSGVIMIGVPHAYWITIPCGLLWLRLVIIAGKRLKRRRDPIWGCWACRGEVPRAKPIIN